MLLEIVLFAPRLFFGGYIGAVMGDSCVLVCIQSGFWDARSLESRGAQLGQFDYPVVVAVTSQGDVWVADNDNRPTFCLAMNRRGVVLR